MNISAFSGIYYRAVRVGSIGFPTSFYSVVQNTGTAVLTVEEEGLFGYSPDVWKTITVNPDSLIDSRGRPPIQVREVLKSAQICRIHIDPYLMDDSGRITAAIDLIEPYRLVVPQEMIRQAKLKRRGMLIGVGYHFEIWSPINWLKIKNRLRYRKISRRNPPDLIA